MTIRLDWLRGCATALVTPFRRDGSVDEACFRKLVGRQIKGGVKLLMQSLAQELAPHRIRVNSIAPGAIQTPINREAWETPEALASLLRLIPYGRMGQPEDIGKAVAWVASDDADYVHGQTLFVDGGMTLYPEFAHGG